MLTPEVMKMDQIKPPMIEMIPPEKKAELSDQDHTTTNPYQLQKQMSQQPPFTGPAQSTDKETE